MNSEPARVVDVAARLRDAGYPFVQSEVQLPNAPGLRVDVLAWAADEDGELVPRVAVEIKRSARPEIALPLLAQTRAALGTTEHFVVTDEGWFSAASGLRAVEPVDGPSPIQSTHGELRSVSLATNLLRQRIWKDADRLRGHTDRFGSVFEAAVSGPDESAAIETAAGDVVAVEPTTLWNARRAAWADLASHDLSTAVASSPPVIATAVASLVGERLNGVALDPFCGSGSFLWALTERAMRECRGVEAMGRDLDAGIIQTATLISRTAPSSVTFETGDAFTSPLPEADVIVTAPPMGLRLADPHTLQNGTSTRQGDLAAVDICLRALREGGRAVFQLTPGITFQSQAESFRSYLASNYRIAALIGCPSGSAFGTQIKTVLMVVDKAQPGPTFVAQLAEDWEAQLAATGPTMSAALAHIDGMHEEAQ